MPTDPVGLNQLLQLASSFGPAFLAGVAIWWLSGKHERDLQKVVESWERSFSKLAESILSQTKAIESRNERYEVLERDRIRYMTEIAANLNEGNRRMQEQERELSEIKKQLGINGAHHPQPRTDD